MRGCAVHLLRGRHAAWKHVRVCTVVYVLFLMRSVSCRHGKRSAWPLYLRCDNLVASARNRPSSKAILTYISFPQQTPSESDDSYKYIKSVLYVRLLEAIISKLNRWTVTGVHLHIPGRSQRTVVIPRLCLLLADIMEHRMMLATHGTYDTRCVTKVVERRRLAIGEEDEAVALASDSEDIVFDLSDVSEARLTPQEQVHRRARLPVVPEQPVTSL
jgi:hypothetical protein